MIMEIAIIVSAKEPADTNIKQRLIEQGFKEAKEEFDGHNICTLQGTDTRLYTTDTDSVHCENIDRKIDADLFIFATRHSSEADVKSLSVHAAGNWGKVDFGGSERKLCVAPASYLKAALLKMDELVGDEGKTYSPAHPPPPAAKPSAVSNPHPLDVKPILPAHHPPPAAQAAGALSSFEVIQECTHHGPFLEKPCMFIEIGSSAAEWGNKDAGKVIAETIIYLIKNKPNPCKTIFGIGGLHHTPEFSKIARRTEYAVGHVCPKYNLENLDEEMIRQALERDFGNDGEVEVILDWKGLKAGKERILKLLDEMGIGYKKTRDLT